jgi:hypothetical protein
MKALYTLIGHQQTWELLDTALVPALPEGRPRDRPRDHLAWPRYGTIDSPFTVTSSLKAKRIRHRIVCEGICTSIS